MKGNGDIYSWVEAGISIEDPCACHVTYVDFWVDFPNDP